MKDNNRYDTADGPDRFIRMCHLGLMVFGIAAWLSGDAADDYKQYEHLWFTVHSWIGMGLASSISIYMLYCTIGPKKSRFSRWVPCTKERFQMVRQDIEGLLRFRLPDRQSHQGLAGLVQFFGVLVFLGMAVTGGLMFAILEPGSKAQGLIHAIKEVHETGEILIPLYLSIHVGAVVLHSISGHHVWKRMFFFKGYRSQSELQVKREVL